MKHDVAAEISHGGFLRMLEQSVDYSSPGDKNGLVGVDDSNNGSGGAPIDEKDEARVDWLEESVNQLKEISDGIENRLKQLETQSKMAYKAAAIEAEKAQQRQAEKIKQQQQQQQQQKAQKDQIKKSQTTEQQQQQQQQQPLPTHPERNLTGMNILLLYADDWTHHTLSSYHNVDPVNPILQTPILDALASDGIRFTHNCVTTSVCWISRATLYTGQYMSRHKTTEPCCWSGGKKPKQKLERAPENWNELSFYEILARNGYHVGHAGKWGVYLPFDKNVHFNVEEDGWHYRKIGRKTWHITEKNEADALRFLVTRPRDKPFFLNVAFYATHAKDGDKRQYMPQEGSMGWYKEDVVPIPKTATDEAWKKMPYFFDERNEGRARWHWRYDNYTKHQTMMKNYYRMATEVDAACGVILEELRRQGELDNTVILFTTDNGNFHAEHGLADKWYPHQESIRVPLIIRDPRMKDKQRGTTNDAMTLNIDLAPTILSFAGLSAPDKMMGRDMTPLYLHNNPPEWRNDFFYEHPIISQRTYIPSSEALVRKDYKYMYWPDYKYEQLFDLRNDPGELEDVINSTNPEIVEMKKSMKERFEYLKKLVKSEGVVTV